MERTTELLVKSLAGLGVLLALPAVAGVFFGLLHLSLSRSHPPDRDTALAFAVVFISASGLWLLWRTVACARRPWRSPPAWLWPTLSLYLMIGVGAGAAWTLHNYSLARAGELRSWDGDDLDTSFALWPVSFLLLPASALVLAVSLWARQAPANRPA